MPTMQDDLQPLPTADGVASASLAIDPVFLATPLVRNDRADAELGCRMWAKVETLNPIRSFKGRGAEWWIANLDDTVTPIVLASAGNFGQGLAYAAARQRRRIIVFASITANVAKVEAMRRLGAEVILEGKDFDEAKSAARRFANIGGHLFVEDGANRYIAEGAGTIAQEITESSELEDTKLDAIVVPLGNGSLLTGMGVWMREKLPACRVIGVVATGAPAMMLSWEHDKIETTRNVCTIADGIAVREPVPYALRSMRDTVDQILAVDDASITQAMIFCREHYGLVVEPAGAVGIAAVLRSAGLFDGASIATVLCGGNLSP